MKIITGKQIAKHFSIEPRIADSDYLCPSESWIMRTLNPFFKSFLKYHKVGIYKDTFDCDNFSDGYFFFAQVLHAQRKNKVPQAVAIGTIWFNQKGKYPHAINCVLLDKDGKTDGIELRFIEPQTRRFIRLTPTERKSIWYARF